MSGDEFVQVAAIDGLAILSGNVVPVFELGQVAQTVVKTGDRENRAAILDDLVYKVQEVLEKNGADRDEE